MSEFDLEWEDVGVEDLQVDMHDLEADTLELETEQVTEIPIPAEFFNILKSFVSDIQETFPEYKMVISQWWGDIEEERQVEGADSHLRALFQHCALVFPDRFMEIVSQNADMFSKDKTYSTEFLPGISFKYLWHCEGLTDPSRETIWKYLKMILVCVVQSGVPSASSTENAKTSAGLDDLFQSQEFQEKMQETILSLQSLLISSSAATNTTESPREEEEREQTQESPTQPPPSNQQNDSELPELPDLFGGFLDGKLGELAKEIAGETSQHLEADLAGEMADIQDPSDIMKRLFQKPDKLMNIMKSVSSKLDERLRDGNVDQSELMNEATNILGKIQNMPGMANLQSMMNKMAGSAGAPREASGKGQERPRPQTETHPNVSQNDLRRRMKQLQMLERIRKKEEKKIAEQQTSVPCGSMANPPLSDEELVQMFQVSSTSSSKKSSVSKKK